MNKNIIYIYYIMAIIPTGKSILLMCIVLSPTIISATILLESFTHGRMSGIIYLSGMILSQLIGFLTRPFLKGLRPDIKAALTSGEIIRDRRCSIIEEPYYSQYSSPSFHALFFSFTFIYLFLAKFLEGFEELDIFRFIFLIIVWVADLVFRITYNCVTPLHYLYGCFIGLVLGTAWWWLVSTLNKDMLINVETDSKKCKILSTNMTCKMVEVDDNGTEGKEYALEPGVLSAQPNPHRKIGPEKNDAPCHDKPTYTGGNVCALCKGTSCQQNSWDNGTLINTTCIKCDK